MMPPVLRLPLFLLLCVALAGSGCSKQARMERLLASGNKLVEAGDFKKAEEEYRTALRLVPGNPRVLGRVGIMIYHQGRPLSAYYMLAGVRADAADDLDIQLTYGLACLSLARTSDARIVAKKVLEARPEDEDALLLLVDTCLTTRDNEEAQRLVAQYRERSKNTSGHHVALGGLLLVRREQAAAAAEIRKALEINPKSSAAHAYLGSLAEAQGKMEQAGQAFKQAADLSPLRAPRRIKYIDFLMKKGSYEDARREVTKVIDGAPDYVPAWVLKMKIAFLEGKYEESDSAAGEVLIRDRANYEAMMQRAAIKLAKGNIDGVIAELQNVEKLFERSPQVKYQLALAYLKSGNAGRAEDHLLQALRLSPHYDEASLLLAEVTMQNGNLAGAIAMLTQLLERRPQIPRAHMLLARAQRAQGDVAKSLHTLQVLASLYPRTPDGPYLVGTVLMELGRRKEAREAFEQAVLRAGNYWPAVEGLVNLDLTEQQVGAAAARVKALLERTPAAIPALLLRAKIRLTTGDATGSEADLLKAIELEPKAAYPYLLLTRIYFHTGRAKEALDKLTALAAQKPTLPVLMQLGMLHTALQRPDEARANYEAALALDPAFTPALNNLAVLLGESSGQLEKAYDLARQAQGLVPNDPVVADTFGWILFRKGQYERALRFAQQAAEKIPADPTIPYHLGMIQYYLGQVEQARQSFQPVLAATGESAVKEDAARRLAILALDAASPDPSVRTQLEQAVRKDPQDPVALIRLAQIEARAGQTTEAAARYEAVLKINPGVLPAMMALIELNFGPLAKPDRARELVKLARAAAPNDPRIAWQLGRQLLAAGEFASASTLLADALRALPGEAELLFDVARSRYSLGRVTEAGKALEEAIAIKGAFPGREPAARMMALIAATRQAGPLPEADLAAAREVLAKDAGNVPALMVVALDLERRRNYREAAREYEKALKLHPLFAPAMRQLAILYGDQLGDDQKAEQFAQKALQTLPDDAELEYQLGVINYRRGDYAAAVRFLQQSKRKQANHAATLFFLGMAQFQLKNPMEAKVDLQRALQLKLPPQEETEARRMIDMINRGVGL